VPPLVALVPRRISHPAAVGASTVSFPLLGSGGEYPLAYSLRLFGTAKVGIKFLYQPRSLLQVDIATSKWVHRGWTYQESAVSTRMVFFSEGFIHFLCPTWVETQGWPHLYYDFFSQNACCGNSQHMVQSFPCQQAPVPLVRLSSFLSNSEISTHKFYDNWEELVMRYSRRQFTRPSDVLSALAGLVSAFTAATGDSYCFGLWKSCLARGLLWISDDDVTAGLSFQQLLFDLNTRTRHAPTWSWASRSNVEYTHRPQYLDGIHRDETLRCQHMK